jgi:hypothetical protein
VMGDCGGAGQLAELLLPELLCGHHDDHPAWRVDDGCDKLSPRLRATQVGVTGDQSDLDTPAGSRWGRADRAV